MFVEVSLKKDREKEITAMDEQENATTNGDGNTATQREYRRKRKNSPINQVRQVKQILNVARDKEESGRPNLSDRLQAQALQKTAEEGIERIGETVRGGEEVIEISSNEEGIHNHRIVDTLQHPNRISLDASEDRLRLLDQMGVLELGLDTAISDGAKTSPERMQSHQLAALHLCGMTLLNRAMNDKLSADEARKLANAGARQFDTFQNVRRTQQALQTGGKQIITVNHVAVSMSSK
jgi:hypothetical protein